VGNDLAKHGNWFHTFREFALVAYSSKEYAVRFQMSILQDTISKRREQITKWRDVLYQNEECIVYITATS